MYEHTSLRKLIEVGTRFGRLQTTAPVDFSDKRPGRGGFVACICDCGTECIVRTASLRNGRSQSCGCLQREAVRRTAAGRNRGLQGVHDPSWWRKHLAVAYCELCNTPLTSSSGKTLARIDHVHGLCTHSAKTACATCIRGVLCHTCNCALVGFDRWGWPDALVWYRDRRPLLTLSCSKDRNSGASC